MSIFKKVAAAFGKAWPFVKTGSLALGGAALTAAGAGAFGPKGQAAGAAVATLIGLFSHRPQDNAAATGQEEGK